jgi:hypothetical protein
MLEDGDCIWSVGLAPEDEDHVIFGGESTWLGPDGTLWTFRSSPNCFDHEIVETALTGLYLEGVAGLVDAGSLAERVSFITRQRNEAIYGLADAARRGELRESQNGSSAAALCPTTCSLMAPPSRRARRSDVVY